MAAPTRSHFDVVIAGAGPAGAALALRLARLGRRVALIERSRYERPRIGETLSPQVQPELHALGLWPEFLALGPLPSWGTTSIWGESAAHSLSHLNSPWGSGWHVDRAAFDRLLAEAAERAGSVLLQGRAARSPVHDGQRWRLHAGEALLTASVLIDASGRSAQIGRQLGAQRVMLDPLVGVAAQWQGLADDHHHLLVEAVDAGWWYSAPLPGEGGEPRMITMLMTDADRCAQGRLQQATAWRQALEGAPATRRRVGAGTLVQPPRAHPAQSHRLRRAATPSRGPWLAIGDAALSVDPLTGSGVVRALQQAAQAASLVDDALRAPSRAAPQVAAHESAMDELFTRYLWERADQYAMEARFESPFWTRRRGLVERLVRPAGIEPAT